jgi:hypothetical protein
MLAAIFRIADGLDYLHTGSVHDIHCTLSPDEVTCTVTGTGDITAEKERAKGRADLFLQIFEKILVIR